MNEQNEFYLLDRIKEFAIQIGECELDQKVRLLNEARSILHQISPFKNEPVDFVEWVKNNEVIGNEYNPNSVAAPEMALLKLSIQADGYTQPIVSFKNEDNREVVDGFHRHKVGKFDTEIQARINGYLPLVTINDDRLDKADRIAATVRHNRARGKHSIDGMSDIVVDLKKRNWSDSKISKHLGMDADEVLRLWQISGLTEAFKDVEFTEAWEPDMVDDERERM
jgi:ParB-like chromosome segregation protein Spo0J